MDDRLARRTQLAKNKEWQSFLGEMLPLMLSQESKILLPTNFSPIR